MKMTDLFYIVMIRENWYRLHVSSTHYCLGAGSDVDKLLGTVYNLTRKYKRPEKLLKALSNLEDKGKVYPNMLSVYEEDYNNLSAFWSGAVKNSVEKAMEDSKFDTPFHRSRKSLSVRRKIQSGLQSESDEDLNKVEPSTVEVPVVKKKSKRLLGHHTKLSLV